ncbi:MAG: glycosyltransferase family 4 protein [Halioglobus sp.]|nr:glycosyltransferase family 4 protein [Halioglobus sp.]
MDRADMYVLMIGPGLTVRGGISSVERLIVECSSQADFSIAHLSSYEDGGFLKKLFAFGKSIIAVPGIFITTDIALVHIHFSHYGSTLRKILLLHYLRLFRRPIVMHSHGSDFHIFFKGLPGIARRFLQYSLSRTTRIIVLSQSWKDFYVNDLQLDPSNIFVLQNPVETSDPSSEIDKGYTQYLFLGRLERRKGIYDIVEAFAKLDETADLKDMRFIAAGDGDLGKVKALIADKGLEPVIAVEGWVDRERVADLLQASDVLLLPSYNEGLPMALLEAMGSGLTVITSPVGGIPEVIKDGVNGILVPPGDINALIQAIWSSRDANLRSELGNNAKDTVQSNSLEVYCKKLFKLYESICHYSLK